MESLDPFFRVSEHGPCFTGKMDVTDFYLGKELGNCTHQWTSNDDTNTEALSTLSLLQVKRRKIDNNRRKKEAEKRTKLRILC